MTDYLKNILENLDSDHGYANALIDAGIISKEMLVREALASKEGLYILNVAANIKCNAREKMHLARAIISIGDSYYIASFALKVSDAPIEALMLGLINSEFISIKMQLENLRCMADKITDEEKKAKILAEMLNKFVDRIIKEQNLNQMKSLKSCIDNEKLKAKLDSAIQKLEEKESIEKMSMEERFHKLAIYYREGKIDKIKEYREYFAPLFNEPSEEPPKR